MIKDLYLYRSYIWKNAARDLRVRYSGTGLGIFWNVISPLLQILIYTLVFSQIMPQRSANASPIFFVVYLCSGLLPWTAFTDGVIRGTNTFIENATYLKKLPIPESIFVAQSVLSSTLNLGITLVLLIVLALVCGLTPHVSWLLLPVVLLLWQTLAFGMGLILGTLNVFIRDIAQIVPVIFQVWMWSVPVVYRIDILPQAYRNLLPYNPPYAYLASIHGILLESQLPSINHWLMMLFFSSTSVLAGLLVLRSLRVEIRDVI